MTGDPITRLVFKSWELIIKAQMNIQKIDVGIGRQETGVERSKAMGELSFHSQHNANRNAPGGGALAFSFPIVQVAKRTGDPKSRLQV